jgi:tRNA nucleotidyltransferase/poly(A) polymerase
LRGRDFTCNAVALSLNRASRGLLLDPMNGLADIERKELRAVSTYGFYDDPSRLLRLVRYRVRMGYTVEERTQMQVANAREAEVEKHIPARALGDELKRISGEDSPTEIFKGLEEGGLLALFSPALSAKLNLQGLARYEKAIRVLPDDTRWRAARFGTFLYCLTEKLTPKDRQALMKATEMPKSDIDQWQKIEARAKKLEAALRAPKVRKPSHVYHIVVAAAPEDVLFVLYHCALKPVQERLRNHFQKYAVTVQEITPEEWATIEPKPGTPKYAKAREEFISEILNRKPKKPVEEEVPPPPPPVPEPVMGRRGR